MPYLLVIYSFQMMIFSCLSCRLPKLYLCEFCLKYMKSTSILMRHMVIKTCMQRPLFSSCYSISLWDQKSLLSCFCRQSVNGFILQQTKFTAKVKSLCLRWMVQLTRWVHRKTFQNFYQSARFIFFSIAFWCKLFLYLDSCAILPLSPVVSNFFSLE